MKQPTKALFWAFALYAVLSLVSMATMSIGAGILFVVIAAELGGPKSLGQAIWKELRHPLFRIYCVLSLGLAAACVLSLWAAKAYPLSYGGRAVHVRFWSDIAKLGYFLWPLILVAGLRALSKEARASVLRVWIGAFALLSVIGIAQYFTGWPRPRPIPGIFHRFHATLFLGHHLSVASILIFPFFAALDLARGRRKAVLWAIVAAGLLCLIATYSRTLWLALPFGILVWILWSLPKRWAWIGVSLLVMGAIGASQLPQVQARLHGTIGIQTREALWKANLEFFKERPWTGVGWRKNGELSGYYLLAENPGVNSVFSGHAHNNFLDLLGGTGIIGTLPWLAWCAFAVFLAFTCVKKGDEIAPFAKGLVCAWIVFQLNGLTQVNFWEGKVMHQMMWVLAWSLLWVGMKAGNERV